MEPFNKDLSRLMSVQFRVSVLALQSEMSKSLSFLSPGIAWAATYQCIISNKEI